MRQEREDGRKKGRYLGIGLSSWIEICGFGPSAAPAPATGGVALVESAQVRVFPTGSVTVYVGTHSHGQGHDTTFPQIVADTLGVPYDSIELRHGDTAEGPAFGYGTYGSRSLAVGGMAVHKASMKVVDKARKLAAHIFEAADEDVVFDHGQFYVKGRLTDYLIPTANEFPNFELGRTITPSPTNELGVKGIGEAGTIASSIAIINAICDALSPLGIKHVDMPASPDRLWKQIKEAS